MGGQALGNRAVGGDVHAIVLRDGIGVRAVSSVAGSADGAVFDVASVAFLAWLDDVSDV